MKQDLTIPWVPMTTAEVVRLYVPQARLDCAQCAGKGMVALQQPGKPHTASMARCELCSGFGRVRA